MQRPVFLKPKDVESLFGIPENTQKILRLKAMRGLDRNPIPFVKRGRSVLYSLEELTKWLNSQSVSCEYGVRLLPRPIAFR